MAFESRSRDKLKTVFCREYGVEDSYPMELHLSPDDEQWARSYLAREHGKDVVLIAPYSAKSISGKQSVYKDWDDDRWREVISNIQQQGYKVYQLGTIDETRLGADEFISDNITKIISLVKYCYTFIGVDTWIGHAGAALNKPGIVLFGGTDPLLFGHDTNHNICVGTPDQSVQWLMNSELDNREMMKIQVEDVMREFDALVHNVRR
jgi:ADP-heptose:LPS heptosyltransferase